MKILALTSSFPKYEGSHEGGFIFDFMNRISIDDFKPVVLAPHFSGGKIQEFRSGVKIYRFIYFLPTSLEHLAYGSGLAFNAKRNFIAFVNLIPFCLSELLWTWIIIKRDKVSLLHTHWLIPQGLVGAFLHKLIKIPHIATIHGSDLNLIKNITFLKILCRFIVRNSDLITVNSSYMKQQLLSVAPDSAQKIQVIPMGVDSAKYSGAGNPDLNREYEANQIILSVGRLIDWKGTIYLIDAMPHVLQHYPDALLLIIGSGPEKEHLVQRIRQLSLGKNVQFLGMVSDKELQAYYHASDVFVLPSINKYGKTEGLGVVLLEAMASGCPVIGSNVGGIPDIIFDGENGFLVPEQHPVVLAEKIVQILSDPNMREKFRKNGYARIDELFTWDKIAVQFSEAYLRDFDHKLHLGPIDVP